MDSSEGDFGSGGASGASLTYPVQCSSLRKNGYVVIKGRPCKVVDMSTSKTGKHGHAKVHLVALDIFTGKKYEDLCPSTHNINVPNVTRTDFQLADIDEEGFLNLIDEKGECREDLKIPEGELGTKIREEFEKAEKLDKQIILTVMRAMDEEYVVAFKNATN